MRIRQYRVTRTFQKKFDSLPKRVQKQVVKTLNLLKKDPKHPSLRLHKLRGKHEGTWSVSVTRSHRILFRLLGEGIVVLLTVGTHTVYE